MAAVTASAVRNERLHPTTGIGYNMVVHDQTTLYFIHIQAWASSLRLEYHSCDQSVSLNVI